MRYFNESKTNNRLFDSYNNEAILSFIYPGHFMALSELPKTNDFIYNEVLFNSYNTFVMALIISTLTGTIYTKSIA